MSTHHTGDQRVSNSSSSPATQKVPYLQHFIVRPGTTKHTASGTVTVPGPIVPLIPIDQLPEWIDVVGIPRDLTVEQTMGLSNLGTVIKYLDYYEVHLHGDLGPPNHHGRVEHRKYRNNTHMSGSRTSPGNFMDPKAKSFISTQDPVTCNKKDARMSDGDYPDNSSSSSKTSDNNHGKTNAMNHDPVKSKNKDKNTSRSSTASPRKHTAPIPLNPRIPSPAPSSAPSNPYPILRQRGVQPPVSYPASGVLSNFAQGASHGIEQSNGLPYRPGRLGRGLHNNGNPMSVYCRHWCHHGTCKWGPVCRYQHAMPSTPEGLREVGLLELPSWWVAGMASAFSGGMGNPLMGMGMGMAMGMFGGGVWGGGIAGRPKMKDIREMRERWEKLLGHHHTWNRPGGRRGARGLKAVTGTEVDQCERLEERDDESGEDESLGKELSDETVVKKSDKHGEKDQKQKHANSCEREKLVDI